MRRRGADRARASSRATRCVRDARRESSSAVGAGARRRGRARSRHAKPRSGRWNVRRVQTSRSVCRVTHAASRPERARAPRWSATRRPKNAPPRRRRVGGPETRATRSARRCGRAPRGTTRGGGSRGEGGNGKREASAGGRAARAGSGARGDAKASRRRERRDGTRGIGGGEAAEAYRRSRAPDAESRRRDEVSARVRAAAAARAPRSRACRRGHVTDDIDDIDEVDDGEEDRVEDEDDRVFPRATSSLPPRTRGASFAMRHPRAPCSARRSSCPWFEHADHGVAREGRPRRRRHRHAQGVPAAGEALD